MLNFEQKKQRLAELYGVPVADVPDDLSLDDLSWLGTRRPRVKAYRLDELELMSDPTWVLTDWVPAGLTVCYAKPKAGKTFWVLTLAVCYAMGIDFFGLRIDPDNKEKAPRRVLYIASEGGGKATWRRIRRIAAVLNVDMAELRNRLEVVNTSVKVDDAKSVDDFLLLNPGRWDMVVVDTLARSMFGDENSTSDMNLAITGLDHIRAETGAVSVIVVHHEGHREDRMRGSSALLGALDGMIRVVRKDGFNYVTVQELREAPVPEACTMVFKLNRDKGVLELTDAGGSLQGVERVMYDELVQMVQVTDGEPVKVSAWKDRLDLMKPDPLEADRAGKGKGKGKPLTDEARRGRWRRLIEALAQGGTIKLGDGGKTVEPNSPFKETPVE